MERERQRPKIKPMAIVYAVIAAITPAVAFSGKNVGSFTAVHMKQKTYYSTRTALQLAQRIPVLDEWRILRSGEVVGIVSNHPTIDDGDVITTSPIAELASSEEGEVVVTESGSKYKLGVKSGAKKKKREAASQKLNGMEVKSSNIFSKSAASKTASAAVAVSDKAQQIARMRDLKLRYKVSGKTVGNGKYILCGTPKRSTSGKSQIWSAYRSDPSFPDMPLIDSPKLTIKISPNLEAINREAGNYNRVTSGLFSGRFVNMIEFLPDAQGKGFKSQCALVIEAGRKDLKALLAERGGRGFEGRALRDAAAAAAQCLQAMHSSNMVWTDLKTENFVVVGEEVGDNGGLPGVKGIDLESAIPRGGNPVDFSPEACSPEFADAYIAGDGVDFVLDYPYDIWSLGMMLYELSTGKPYFDGKSPAQITKGVKTENFITDVSAITDAKLRNLISQCLNLDPRQRPSISQVLLHPYFLTTGIGPFGW